MPGDGRSASKKELGSGLYRIGFGPLGHDAADEILSQLSEEHDGQSMAVTAINGLEGKTIGYIVVFNW